MRAASQQCCACKWFKHTRSHFSQCRVRALIYKSLITTLCNRGFFCECGEGGVTSRTSRASGFDLNSSTVLLRGIRQRRVNVSLSDTTEYTNCLSLVTTGMQRGEDLQLSGGKVGSHSHRHSSSPTFPPLVFSLHVCLFKCSFLELS